jgi:Uma2 family endonuclease
VEADLVATVKPDLITAEQYRIMPPPEDGSKVELVRGELETMCRPGFRHGLRQGRVYSILDNYGRSHGHGRAVVETGIVTEREPDTVRGPDVSYWSAARLPLDQEPDGYPDMAPDLAVEVLSPWNRLVLIRAKMGEYFDSGVRMVWVVDPEDRTVTVYRSLDQGQILHESATLQVDDVLPGFACQVAELFA